jgi:hypothetical protein
LKMRSRPGDRVGPAHALLPSSIDPGNLSGHEPCWKP